MLEGEYLELVAQLKKDFDLKEAKMNKLQEENDNLKKIFISCYGSLRVLDYLASGSDIDLEVQGLIDIIRGYLSDTYDNLF